MVPTTMSLSIMDILYQACPNPSSKFPGEDEYRISTHCVEFVLTGHFAKGEFVFVNIERRPC